MRELVYINRNIDNVDAVMNKLAEEYVQKLTFNTREEYLVWVKQWKEDMKIVTLYHTTTKYTFMKNGCKRVDKIDRYTNKLNKMPKLTEPQVKRADELMDQYFKDYNLSKYFKSSHYLFWYMLILRKASKIKAGKQRAERLAIA